MRVFLSITFLLLISLSQLVHLSFIFEKAEDLQVEVLMDFPTKIHSTITAREVKWIYTMPKEHFDVNISLPIYQNDMNITGRVFDNNDSEVNLTMNNVGLYRAHYSFCRFRNIYYRSDYSYALDGISYKADEKVKKSFSQKVSHYIETLVVVTGFHSNGFFADAFSGGMIRLLFIPKEILNQATIMYTYKGLEKYFYEFFDLCGAKNAKLVLFGQTDLVFARELYTVLPYWIDFRESFEVHNGFFGDFLNYFVNKMEKHYMIENIKAEEYGVMKREKGMKRYVKNFDEIFQQMKKEHPDINFKLIGHGFKSFQEGAKVMKAQKWVFAPTGSSLFYAMFMHPGSRVCFYLADWFDYPCFALLNGAQLYYIGFFNRFRHFAHNPAVLNQTRVCHYVNISLQ